MTDDGYDCAVSGRNTSNPFIAMQSLFFGSRGVAGHFLTIFDGYMHQLGLPVYLGVKSYFERNCAVSDPISSLERAVPNLWGYHLQMVPPARQTRNSEAVYIESVSINAGWLRIGQDGCLSDILPRECTRIY